MANALKVVNSLISSSKYSKKCPYSMTPEGITIHNTANDASAANEIAYMKRNDFQTSFHYAVDDVQAILGIPLTRNAWHAGDGGSGYGNRKTIGIEICYSKSGGSKFTKAEKNAQMLIASLMVKYGWTKSDLGGKRINTHQYRSDKYCPHRTLGHMKSFYDGVKKEYDKLKGNSNSGDSGSSSGGSSGSTNSNTLKLDGSFGKDTVKTTQKVLGTTQDGKISNQPNSNKKYLPNAVKSVWEFKKIGYKSGSQAVKAMQKLFGTTQDGWFGKKSVMAMQVFLGVTVDGSMGPATVKAWQKYLNSKTK